MAQSVSKKAYNNGNGFGDQAVYDDVFGGPTKFGVPTLSPRLEDYAEIFGSFHASRASAIPILDLPALDDEADFSLDVRGSSHLDYSQVFGGSSALDFAVSFKELFNQSKKTAYAPSEEAWSPAQSESLSDELDPSVCSERSWSLSNEGSYQSYYCIKQFNVSHNKASQRSKKDNLTGMTQTPQPHAVPGFTCAVNGSPLSQKMRDRDMPFVVMDDHNPSVDFSGQPGEGNQFRKTMSHQATSFGALNFGADLNPVTYGRTVSYTKETFVTVTDISLRTQPSNLPPPLRSPPVLAEKDGDSDRLKAKFKARKNFSSGETAGDRSPAFLDVEVDACSSAAAVKDAVEKAQAKLTNVKELMEGKKEGVHCRTMLGSVNDAKYKKEKAMEIDLSNCFNEKRAHGTCQRDFIGMKTFSGEERQKVMKAPLVDSDSTEGEKHINVAKISANKKHGKDKLCLECNKSEASVTWRQGAECYQLVETDKSRKNIDQAKDHSVLMQNTQFHEHGQEKKEIAALQELEDDNKKIRVDREAIQWDGGKKEISKATKESSRQEKQEMKVKVYQEGCEQVENEKKRNIAQQKIPAEGDKSEECENLAEVKHEEHGMKVERKLKEATERIEDDKKHKDACEKEENERRLSQTLEGERYEKRLKKATEPAEIEERRNEALDQEERQKQQGESCERENNENRKKEVHGSKENEKRLKEALEQVDNKKILKKALEREDTEKRVKIDLVQKANQNCLKLPRERDEHEERPLDNLRQQEIERKLKGTHQQGGNGERQKEAHERKGSKERLNEAYEREENEKRVIEAWEQAENKVRLQEACGREESDKRLKEVFKHKEIEKRPEEANACEETQKGIDVAGYSEECMGCGKDHEQYAKDENRRRLKSDRGTCVDADLETFKGSNGAVEVVNVPGEEQFSSFGLTEEDTRNEQNQTRKTYSTESLHLQDGMTESVEGGIGSRQTQREKNEKVSEIASNTTGKPNVLAFELGEWGFNVKEAELAFEEEETEDKFMSSQIVTELVENGRKMGTDQTTVLEEKRNAQFITQKVSTRQNTERRGSDLRDILAPEESEKDDSIKKERELEKDHLRKIEEEREREREREKDRMAVDREAPDARERVFVEARERAARAAVERATAEVRQRVMVEARERLEKASAEARERSLAETASAEARLRAERAVVERATAEARERAFQKVMNENAFEARERVEGSVADKSSASCNNGGVRQSFSFSDLQEVRCQGFGSSTSCNSRRFVEVEGESEQRCKARLERHQRTAERAAKALAEKNMCDLLALKEQAERNRLAEALDADVKRWSGGKKGNLRALLSTLQYILGPDSGWQPIPLTEVITSAAVKKAYRKATLCVHPDKLQQRGASVQQKYLCEKVFDLLKEAWNKFNSEER